MPGPMTPAEYIAYLRGLAAERREKGLSGDAYEWRASQLERKEQDRIAAAHADEAARAAWRREHPDDEVMPPAVTLSSSAVEARAIKALVAQYKINPHLTNDAAKPFCLDKDGKEMPERAFRRVKKAARVKLGLLANARPGVKPRRA
jgi:hypothetical protein